MRLGSIYINVNDFEKSVEFYEKLLEMPVSQMNMNRFAMFNYHGQFISIMNSYFDIQNPDKVINKGLYYDYFDNLKEVAKLPNTRKIVLNFWSDDLKKEHDRIMQLKISNNLTKIRYLYNVSPYYYFSLTDLDGNIIEIAGEYTPQVGEFD